MTVEDRRHTRTTSQALARVARDQWEAASYRCPCGFASNDADEFGRHLDAAEGAEPEHFEVLDGWTLKQVRQWQATVMTPEEPRMTARAAEAS